MRDQKLQTQLQRLEIGSSVNSQHVADNSAAAADFEIPGVDNKELATWISKNTEFDQLILEFYDEGDPNSGWVHCSAVTEGQNTSLLLRDSI